MQNKQQKIKTLPQEHDYLRRLFGDAIWLILTKVEEEEAKKQAEIIPRELVIRIRLMPNEKELPVFVEEQVCFGKAYDSHYTARYSSNGYAMGTPRMYCADPSDYWRTEASTTYLIKK